MWYIWPHCQVPVFSPKYEVNNEYNRDKTVLFPLIFPFPFVYRHLSKEIKSGLMDLGRNRRKDPSPLSGSKWEIPISHVCLGEKKEKNPFCKSSLGTWIPLRISSRNSDSFIFYCFCLSGGQIGDKIPRLENWGFFPQRKRRHLFVSVVIVGEKNLVIQTLFKRGKGNVHDKSIAISKL